MEGPAIVHVRVCPWDMPDGKTAVEGCAGGLPFRAPSVIGPKIGLGSCDYEG